jgi:hypothetical protein
MSIVLCDTNLWVSAIHFRGVPLEALRRSIAKDTPQTCFDLEDEIARTLVEKFGHTEAVVRSQIDIMLADAIRVSIVGNLTGICRDSKDDFIDPRLRPWGPEFSTPKTLAARPTRITISARGTPPCRFFAC